MNCVREKVGFSNPHVRERCEEKSKRITEKERVQHVGAREQYNGNQLGSNYTGGKRNSAISFMFFNFLEEWGMGRLWMTFKKYMTIFDMFMAQRRLYNGQSYGFVRYKFVRDVKGLLGQLRKIKFGDEWLRVYVAYDIRHKGTMGPGVGNVRLKSNRVNNRERYSSMANMSHRDDRRFVDVVNGRFNRPVINKAEKVEVLDVNGVLLGRSVVGEVKSRRFLSKLLVRCEEQGLGEIEVKLLGGLEVMITMENENMAANVLSDKEHGLKRWMYKLRRGDTLHRTSRLEGNQNLVYGRVQIHTINKGLINEFVNVTVKGKTHKVCVIEEVRDIVNVDIQEVDKGRRGIKKLKDPVDENDMQVDDKEDGEEGQSNSKGSESGENEDYDDDMQVPDFGDRNGGEDEGSRFSEETKVVDTFEGEYGSSKEEVYGEYKDSRGDDSEKNMGNTRGNKDINFDNNIGGPELGSNKEGTNGLEIKEDENIKGINKTGPSARCVGHNEYKGLTKKHVVYNRQQVSQKGIKVDVEKNEELAQDSSTTKRDKREVSPSRSTGSGGGRLRKKRKAISEWVFEVNGEELSFNQGKISGTKCEDKSKKKNGWCVTKAMYVARKNETEELRESKKGVSDAYNEYQEVGNVNNGIFHFGSGKKDANGRCNVSIEQVKEIAEMIGVSWVRGEEEDQEKESGREENQAGRTAGIGEYGKKDWIRSIIKGERPDVIRLQETECGVVDDVWIKDIWGGQGYGYSQLSVNIKEMIEFNEFINNTRLIEIPVGGKKFTRISDDGMKFSKLDRFLLNDKFNELRGNLSVVALDRKLSDHCPIVIKDVELDFGLKPFRVLNIWLKEPDFFRVVEEAWKKEIRSSRPDLNVEELRKEAMRWELEAKKRMLNENKRCSWMEARKQWEDKEREYGNMLHQKSRIKWDVEGDKNSKFRHSYVRRRNDKCNLRGRIVNGL
nr:transposon TX1 [Tanacetum cinerariifolium]